jgi:hypothetical protein
MHMTDDVENPTVVAPETLPKPRWFVPALVAAGVLVLAVAAVSITLGVSALTPQTFTAEGAMLTGYACDSMPGGYEDITQGAGVAVKDPSGKTVALGQLGAGKDLPDGLGCSFPFTVTDVPSGLKIYGVEVTHRGVIQYKEAALKKDGAVMSLGG